MLRSARCVVVLGTLLGSALSLPLTPSVRAESGQSEEHSQSTSVVTAADGTTTTTITEKVTKNGRTTTSRRVTVSRPGEPAHPEPPEPPAPPTPPTARSKTETRTHEETPTNNRDSAALPRETVTTHNRERQKHGVGDLAWDPKLAAVADQWAHHLCRGGKSPPALQHRAPVSGGPGENLWEAVTTEATRYTIGDAVTSWASEEKYYNARTGRCQGGTCGHFTQLMWRNTKQVGCAVATCPAGAFRATVWVCNYAPAGNFANERAY